MSAAPQFHCYGTPKATADLPPLELLALVIFQNARGLMKSRGLTIAQVWQQMVITMKPRPKLTKDNRERMELAIERLAEAGDIRQGDASNRWQAVRR